MKLNLKLVRLFGIGMFLTILSVVVMQAQAPIDWRRIGPWNGNITDIKIKYIKDASLTDGVDSVVVASYGAGIFMADLPDIEGGFTATSATSPEWVPRSNGLPSLKVLSLAVRKIGQGDTMYAGLDGSGIYKTTNAGITWERAFGLGDAMGTRSVYDIAIHPNQSWEAYAATSNGLYKTTSFGNTWMPMFTTGVWRNVKMHEYTTQKVYATSGGQLYRTTTNGASWDGPRAVNGTAEVTAIALVFSALDTLYAGCSDGTVREVTWPGGIFTSTIKSAGLISGNPVTSMAIIPTYSTVLDTIIGNDTIYIATKNGVFKSDKKATTWTQVNVGLESTNSSAIEVYAWHDDPLGDPNYNTSHHLVFTGTMFSGLHAAQTNATRSGATIEWFKIDAGIPVGGLRAVSVLPTHSDMVYATGGYLMNDGTATGVIFRTTSGGAISPTWQIVYPPTNATTGIYAMDVATDWHNLGYVLVADSISGLLISVDTGQTWRTVPTTTGATAVYINRMHPDTMFAARRTNGNGTSQLLRSYNGGATWASVGPTFNYPITSITMDSAAYGSNQTLYVTTWGGGVLKSTDYGVTFREINVGTTNRLVYSISVGDSLNLIIGTDFGSYRSTNAGETWLDNNNIAAGSPYMPDKVTGVFSVRADTNWAVLLNGAGPEKNGIFWAKTPPPPPAPIVPPMWDVANVVATLPPYGTGWIFTADSIQIPLMRDIDMMWQWDIGNLNLPMAGYTASESQAVFVRTNQGFTGITDARAITNPPIWGDGSGPGAETDSVLVWIPDTLSALRGTSGAVGLDFFDIPIHVKNINKVDSFKIAINIPGDYFEIADPTVYADDSTNFLNGTLPLPIITAGTVCQGLDVKYGYLSSTDTVSGLGGAGSWDVSNMANYRTHHFDYIINTGGITVFHCLSRDGKFPDGEVLFKIRVSIAKKDAIADYAIEDSIPAYATPLVAAHNLFLFSGGTINALQGSLLDFRTRFTARASNNRFNLLAQTKFADINHDGIDSIGTFWLRRLPGGDHNASFNDLPGTLSIADNDMLTAMNNRGNLGNSYNGTAPFEANVIGDNKWDPIKNTGRNMTLGISGNDITYPYLTYNNFPELPIRTGDAIGAFYYRNDSLVCGGWGMWVPSTNGGTGGIAFTIWGDDDRTSLKDGFVENEKIYFKLYDSRYKKVWDIDDAVFTQGDGLYHTNETAVVNRLRARRYSSSPITLHAGWNLVSTNIHPRWTEMETIFKSAVVSNHLTLVKDQDGLLYFPQINLVQLPYWNVEQGYWVYMYSVTAGVDEVYMRGTPVDITKSSIPLRQGWNLIAYWGTDAASIQAALTPLLSADREILVKDENGATFWPYFGYDDIHQMLPGRGYELYLNINSYNLMYPRSILPSVGKTDDKGIPGLSLEKSVATKYNPTPTPISQVIAFKVDGYKLQEGDEIGIFTTEGICVGSGKFSDGKTNVIVVSVFGNVSMSELDQKIGAIAGEGLIAKLYTKTDEQEYIPVINNVKWIAGSAAGLSFQAGTIATVNATVSGVTASPAIPTEFAIAQNYPNPFNPTTIIKYQLPVDGFVKIKIFDMLGREIKTLVNQDQKAGYYTIEWDASNNNGRKASSGVYFYNIETSNFKKTMKMMLMK